MFLTETGHHSYQQLKRNENDRWRTVERNEGGVLQEQWQRKLYLFNTYFQYYRDTLASPGGLLFNQDIDSSIYLFGVNNVIGSPVGVEYCL